MTLGTRPNAILFGVKRPRRIPINDRATYHVGTGCIALADGSVIELSVTEEAVFELMLRTPKITVTWERAQYEAGISRDTLTQIIKGIRVKLGRNSVRTHHARGCSLQPQFVATPRVLHANIRPHHERYG